MTDTTTEWTPERRKEREREREIALRLGGVFAALATKKVTDEALRAAVDAAYPPPPPEYTYYWVARNQRRREQGDSRRCRARAARGGQG